jgi:hypothetical protein
LNEERELDELQNIRAHGRMLASKYAAADYTEPLMRVLDEHQQQQQVRAAVKLHHEEVEEEIEAETSLYKTVNKKKKALSMQLNHPDHGTKSHPHHHRTSSLMFNIDEFAAYHAEVEQKLLEHDKLAQHGQLHGLGNRDASPSSEDIARYQAQLQRLPGHGRDTAEAAHSKQAVHMVDQINNDGDVLNNAQMVSLTRPLSGKHLHAHECQKHPAPSIQPATSSSLEHNKQPIEDHVGSFLSLTSRATYPRQYRSQPRYTVHLEQGKTMDDKPILQVHIDHTQLSNAELLEEFNHVDPSLQHSVVVGEQYRASISGQRTRRAEEARNRVLTRAKNKGSLRNDHFTMLSSPLRGSPSLDSGIPNSITSSVIHNGLVLPYLYLTPYVDTYGKLTVDVNNNLYAQSIVYYLDLQQSYVSIDTFAIILHTFFKPAQLDSLQIFDVSYTPQLGYQAAEMLARRLARRCMLIHLNLNGMHIGEMGLKALLQAILRGHGAMHMLRLDLQCNAISIATDAFEYLAHFHSLLHLDLSKNSFSLDTDIQRARFSSGLRGLHHLTALSVAHNKIQDKGLVALMQTFLPPSVLEDKGSEVDNATGCITQQIIGLFNQQQSLAKPGNRAESKTGSKTSSVDRAPLHQQHQHQRYQLQVLDLTACFLTSKSHPNIVQLLEAHRIQPGNTYSYFNTYEKPSGSSPSKVDQQSPARRQDSYTSASSMDSSVNLVTPGITPNLSRLGSFTTALYNATSNNSARHIKSMNYYSDTAPSPVADSACDMRLPLLKLYLGSNLFNLQSLIELKDRYKTLSKCSLILEDDTGRHLETQHTNKQHKLKFLLSDVPMIQYSHIAALKCYELKDLGIEFNRDAAGLI